MGISGREIVERMTAIKPLKCYVQDLGIPNQTISNWKNRNAPPRANELLKIAMYLDVSIEWLLTGQERTAPELPQDVLNLAFEINALPEVYKKIVFDTVQTLRNDVIEKEKEKEQSSAVG